MMEPYLKLMRHILNHGEKREDRTQTGTLSIFGASLRHPLEKGFPLLTTKKIHIKSVIHELLWFLKGSTNIKYLKENGVSIWNEWANEEGELGPIYGSQWRNWPTPSGSIDQIQNLLHDLKHHRYSRRHLISAWNVGEISNMALPPCHLLFQFYISNDDKLSCQFYMRSTDVFLGLPFNLASYALLTHIIAHTLHLKVGDLIYVGGDVHLYQNHLEQVTLQLSRTPQELATLKILNHHENIWDYTFEDFLFENYHPYAAIKAPIAV